jgi:hypothetical protein
MYYSLCAVIGFSVNFDRYFFIWFGLICYNCEWWWFDVKSKINKIDHLALILQHLNMNWIARALIFFPLKYQWSEYTRDDQNALADDLPPRWEYKEEKKNQSSWGCVYIRNRALQSWNCICSTGLYTLCVFFLPSLNVGKSEKEREKKK